MDKGAFSMKSSNSPSSGHEKGSRMPPGQIRTSFNIFPLRINYASKHVSIVIPVLNLNIPKQAKEQETSYQAHTTLIFQILESK